MRWDVVSSTKREREREDYTVGSPLGTHGKVGRGGGAAVKREAIREPAVAPPLRIRRRPQRVEGGESLVELRGGRKRY